MTDPAIQACAESVARGDPDRFRATMAGPVAARAVLFPLYAFNLEVARAPWVTQEPMIAEMRLQFWRDVLDGVSAGTPPRAHEVAAPLAAVLANRPDLVGVLDSLVEARRWDIYKDPFTDDAAFEQYLNATGAGLMWSGAALLGAPAPCEAAIRGFGRAAALASLLLAVPELTSRSRVPLVDGRPEAVRVLAQTGLEAIQAARSAKLPKACLPALWTGWRAQAILRRAVQNPYHVIEGTLPESGFAKDFGLIRRVWLARI